MGVTKDLVRSVSILTDIAEAFRFSPQANDILVTGAALWVAVLTAHRGAWQCDLLDLEDVIGEEMSFTCGTGLDCT